jgi:hypothetical protein
VAVDIAVEGQRLVMGSAPPGLRNARLAMAAGSVLDGPSEMAILGHRCASKCPPASYDFFTKRRAD